MTSTSSFGTPEKDASVTNLAVSKTLVANRVVANDVVGLEINANIINAETLRVNGREITGSNSGGGGGGGCTPFVVPGTATQILTSNGSGGITANSSTLTETGALNIKSIDATTNPPVLMFQNRPVLQVGQSANPTTVIVGPTESAAALTNLGENTMVGCGVGPAMTANCKSNVLIGSNAANQFQFGLNNILIGRNAASSLVNGFDTIIIGKANQTSDSQSNVVIGSSASVNDSTTSGATIIGDSAYVGDGSNTTLSNSCVAIGANARVVPQGGAFPSSLVAIGNCELKSSDSGSVLIGQGNVSGIKKSLVTHTGGTIGIGSIINDFSVEKGNNISIGNNISYPEVGGGGSNVIVGGGGYGGPAVLQCNFSNCICLGRGADAPNDDNQLTLPSGLARPFGGALPANPALTIFVKAGGVTYRLPLYAS